MTSPVKQRGRHEVRTSDDLRVFKHLGRALRLARQDTGISQKDVAERAGVTQAMLSGYESGDLMEVKALDGILWALGLTPQTFAPYIVGKGEAPPKPGDLALPTSQVFRGLFPLLLREAVSQGIVEDEYLETLYQEAKKRRGKA